MIIRSFPTLLALLLLSQPSPTRADDPPISCATSPCPADKPCCSQYSQCGLGAYCLGGCNPLLSHTLNSCVPAPVCRSQTYTLNSLDRIASKQIYLGDSSKADFVSDGTPLLYDGQVILTMAQDTVGTLLASSAYVWYGKISATLRTSRGAGVITAFILLSDVKDEIDYEFVGTELDIAQSNFYYQGITDYTHGANVSLSDTFANYHTYEIDWTPDQITWSIDGQVGRTLKKSDSDNQTAKRYYYPQTPARIQLSIWPGGLASNGKGTIDWAGGPITWDGPDVASNGYYYAMVKEVKVECYDPPGGADVKGSKSYVYKGSGGTEGDVSVTDDGTVLKSLLGSGMDMDKDDPSNSPAASQIAVVPGLSGAGPGTDGQRGDSGSNGASGSQASASASSGGSSDGGSGPSSAASSFGTGFVQGAGQKTGNSGSSSISGREGGHRMLVGSCVGAAMAVFAIALLY